MEGESLYDARTWREVAGASAPYRWVIDPEIPRQYVLIDEDGEGLGLAWSGGMDIGWLAMPGGGIVTGMCASLAEAADKIEACYGIPPWSASVLRRRAALVTR